MLHMLVSSELIKHITKIFITMLLENWELPKIGETYTSYGNESIT